MLLNFFYLLWVIFMHFIYERYILKETLIYLSSFNFDTGDTDERHVMKFAELKDSQEYWYNDKIWSRQEWHYLSINVYIYIYIYI